MADFEKKDTSLLYVQVADYVREKIYSKEWGVDERIPSEHELMAMLHLSRGTVQKGIRSLVEEGLLVQQRGRGTFVIQPVMARPSGNKLHSFAESMNEQGIEYVTRVVEKRIDRANRVCAQNLGIAEGSTFLYLMRVRFVAEQPVMLIESRINLEPCPGLENVDFETANSSPASACSVGLVRVRGGEVVATAGWLIQPPSGHDEFQEWNVRIHGIRPEDVLGAATWVEQFDRLCDFAGADVLVAHNAGFDLNVLRRAAEVTGLSRAAACRWGARPGRPCRSRSRRPPTPCSRWRGPARDRRRSVRPVGPPPACR